jgi:polyisoprenyl-teichoic acid--peptidoglycan teichoic acid transferase
MRRSSPYEPAAGIPPAGFAPTSGSTLAAAGRRSWPQRLIILVGITLAIACLSASAFVGYQAARLGGFERTEELAGLVETVLGEPQNWLIVGSDRRDDGSVAGNRTDTIMVVRIDPKANTIDVLSLHRDLWVRIAGTDGETGRINSAYGDNDSPDRLIQTIKLNFDIAINHYVEVDFQTFQDVVSAVDGVPIYFDRPMRDQKSALHVLGDEAPGCVILDGERALQFVRSREMQVYEDGRWHQDGMADHSRVSRQQFFLRRMFSRAVDRAADPRVANGLVGAATGNVKLDPTVDLDNAMALGRRFAALGSDEIRTWTLPVKDITKPSGAEVLELVPVGSAPILNIFRGIDSHDIEPQLVAFSVLNGSGTPGQAGQVQEAFEAIGYRAEVGGNTSERLVRTEVRHGAGAQEIAGQLERHLSAGADIVADPTLDEGELVVVTGADLTTVMRRPRPYTEPPPPPPDDVTAPSMPDDGATTTTSSPSTMSTTPDEPVGAVPGAPPPGVECE